MLERLPCIVAYVAHLLTLHLVLSPCCSRADVIARRCTAPPPPGPSGCPGEKLSAAAALDALYFFVLAHQVGGRAGVQGSGFR